MPASVQLNNTKYYFTRFFKRLILVSDVKLESVVMASDSCQLVFKEVDITYVSITNVLLHSVFITALCLTVSKDMFQTKNFRNFIISMS